MDIVFWGVAYGLIALAVSIYTFVVGNLHRPTPRLFTTEDQVVLVLASVMIGALWLLFAPAVLIDWLIRFYRYASTKEIHFSLRWARELRTRG